MKEHVMSVCPIVPPPPELNFEVQSVHKEPTNIAIPMDTAGLAAEWGDDAEIRNRVADDNELLVHPDTETWCQPTRENCKSNQCILLPCLKRLAQSKDYRLPTLGGLQAELAELHKGLSKPVSEKTIYTTSVALKKLLGFIKRRTTHKEVTKARVWLNAAFLQICFSLN